MAEVFFSIKVILLLVLASGDAQAENIVAATRNRHGDQYWVFLGGHFKRRSCSPEEPTVLQNGRCEDNSNLRNHCMWTESYF